MERKSEESNEELEESNWQKWRVVAKQHEKNMEGLKACTYIAQFSKPNQEAQRIGRQKQLVRHV